MRALDPHRIAVAAIAAPFVTCWARVNVHVAIAHHELIFFQVRFPSHTLDPLRAHRRRTLRRETPYTCNSPRMHRSECTRPQEASPRHTRGSTFLGRQSLRTPFAEATKTNLLARVDQVDGPHRELREALGSPDRAAQSSRVADIHPAATAT